MTCEIRRRQTTFWDFRCGAKVTRVHFTGKEEFRFLRQFSESFCVADEHPVLADYKHAWLDVYLNKVTGDSEQLLRELIVAVESQVQPWRLARPYFNQWGPDRVLNQGHGKLLSAPAPIVESCRSVLEKFGADFTCLAGRSPRWPRKAFIAAPNWVIASDFRLEALADA